jgi:hypothetical protein
LSAGAVLLKAWFAALASLPKVMKERRKLASLRRIGRREIYRLFSEFAISASEIALKD